MSDLLPGRLKALARQLSDLTPLGWNLLAEHRDQLPREMVADLRKALSLLRRIHEDLHNPRSHHPS